MNDSKLLFSNNRKIKSINSNLKQIPTKFKHNLVSIQSLPESILGAKSFRKQTHFYTNKNSIENKDKTDIEDKSSKNHHKLKRKRYSHNKNSSKLVFKSSKDVKVSFKMESDIQNFSKLKDESNDNDQNGNPQKKTVEEKFKRRNKKRGGTHIVGGTHIHNLPEKLRGIEMSIPVFQESLITQNFGNPE